MYSFEVAQDSVVMRISLAIYRFSLEGLRLPLITLPSTFNFQAAGESARLFALPRIRLFKR